MQREAVDHGGELRILDAAPDQPPGRRLLGRQLLAEERESEGPCRADESRQEPRAARVRNETQLGEGLHEARRARRHDEVTGERNVRTRTGSHAIDRGDHRQRQLAQRQHQRLVVFLDRFAEIGGTAAGSHRTIIEILPRTEAASSAGDHQHARTTGLHGGERGADLGMHRRIEAVETLGAIEGQPGDARVEIEEYVLVAHLLTP